jgi:cyclopropane-fatty-acyl-phospholipid synthase
MAEIVHTLRASERFEGTVSGVDRLARSLVFDRLGRLDHGTLTVVLPDGEVRRFGSGPGRATLEVHSPRFFSRLAAAADVGAGESYMEGEWSTPDLVALTRLFLDNEALFAAHPLLGAVKRAADRVLHLLRRNTRLGARRNIAAHYDLSNQLYALFLDPSMTYSSAYFESPDDSLHVAQLRKYRVLAHKVGLGPGDHVLEIGCGWGGFAEFAAGELGCRVTGLTLSEEQAAFARERLQRAGLDHLTEIRLEDYRDTVGSFDAIVSIEMLEAVGHEYLNEYFAACERLLAPTGRAAVQVITMPDQLYAAYRRGTDFIRRHIFPGGHLPSLQAMQNAAARSSRLVVQDVENIAASYAETLRRWRAAFMDRLEAVRALGFDHRFCRMWEFYLATCEAAFAHGKLATLQLVLARPGAGAVTSLSTPRS